MAATDSLRILVVDDESSLRRSLARYLERRGHTVDEASEGAQALVMIRQQRYDLAVCDVRMPELSGAELLARLDEEGDPLLQGIIFMTGDASSIESPDLFRRTGVPLIEKPFDLLELTAVIESHARARRGSCDPAG